MPVLVGTALAADDRLPAGAVPAGAARARVLIHAGTNLATDFFDFVDGVQPRATLGGVDPSGLI